MLSIQNSKKNKNHIADINNLYEFDYQLLFKELGIDKPLQVYDLETTGLSICRSRIVQFASVKITPRGIQDTINILINPGVEIPEEASKVHGIWQEDLTTSFTFKEVAPWLKMLFKDSIAVTYNGTYFDEPLLHNEWKRAGHNIPSYHHLDVRKMAKEYEPFKKIDCLSYRLSVLYELLCKKPLTGAHDALVDVNGTLALLLNMKIVPSSYFTFEKGKIENFLRTKNIPEPEIISI